jgi:fumarate reductase subunit D
MAATRQAAGSTVAPARPDMSHAFWWGLFAVGGMTAALLLPVHILLQGILGPLGIVPVAGKALDPAGGSDAQASYETLRGLVANPLVKLYLFALISLPLYHAAHRLRYVAIELGLRAARGPAGLIWYAAAVAGTLVAAYVLLTVP